MDQPELRQHIITLFILGTAIILVTIAKQNFTDFFVPNVPNTLIGNGGYPQNNIIQGVHPTGQPMRFAKQMYPARTPYMPKPNTLCSTNEMNGFKGCGATGRCVGGNCENIPYNNTVFGIKTN